MVMIARLPFTMLFVLVMIASNIVAGTVGGTGTFPKVGVLP